jgi:hypothetical protein
MLTGSYYAGGAEHLLAVSSLFTLPRRDVQ